MERLAAAPAAASPDIDQQDIDPAVTGVNATPGNGQTINVTFTVGAPTAQSFTNIRAAFSVTVHNGQVGGTNQGGWEYTGRTPTGTLKGGDAVTLNYLWVGVPAVSGGAAIIAGGSTGQSVVALDKVAGASTLTITAMVVATGESVTTQVLL